MGTSWSLTSSSEPESKPVNLKPSGWFLEKRTMLYAGLAISVSLLIGIVGYWWICDFSWSDSYLNATMILGGMGPVGNVESTAGKIFSGTYAIYCGVFFLVIIAFLFDRILTKRGVPDGH